MSDLDFRGGNAALAVSGGGDSIALMLLFADWARANNHAPPPVLTVDHGLRPQSAKDAVLVLSWAGESGLKADVLRWPGRKPDANIEDAARIARYRLMGEWCAAHGVPALFLAHTQDDQAETFLLRLGRGSGVDGLSAMGAKASYPLPGFAGVAIFRPLLRMSRAELRQFLQARGARWLEDPMNKNERFARVKIRQALASLDAAGVSRVRIAEAAAHLSRARVALEAETERFLASHARIADDTARVDAGALARCAREIGLRALATLLMRVSDAPYRPRFERLTRLFDAVTAPKFAKACTLHSCRIGLAPKGHAIFGPRTLLIAREKGRKPPVHGPRNRLQKGA
jgi:tRNA(Ile)-lysidine synthase